MEGMAGTIHPEAVIGPGAHLEAGVQVGPLARVEGGARVGCGVRIQARARVGAAAVVGESCFIDVGAVVGSASLEAGQVVLGRRVRVREYAVIEGGPPGSPTRVEDEAFVMTRTWLGPGSRVGARAVLTHGSVLGAGAVLEEDAVVGGFCVVEPRVVVGRRAMVGALSRVDLPVPPFTLAHGDPAVLHGINTVGLRRAGVSPGGRQALQRAFRLLFRMGLSPERAEAELGDEALRMEEIRELLGFVRRFPQVTARAPAAERSGDDGEPTHPFV